MSGSDARRGFRYQDHYLLSRLLPHLREVLRAVWRTGGDEVFAALDDSPLQFGIEAKATNPPEDCADAAWDLTIADGSEEEIIEAKSGVVQRPDRLVFWQRLRRTAGSRLHATLRLVPSLVADPDTESMEKWRGLADAAVNSTGRVPTAEPNAPVRDSHQLLEEALFALCTSGAPPAITLPTALMLLGRFRVYEQRRAPLKDKVEKQLAVLFPDAPIAALAGHLRDWLDERASTVGETSKRFGIGAPLREISLLREAAALDRGTWRRWHDLRDEWRGIVQNKATGRLGVSGETIAIAKIQPAIAEGLAVGRGGKLLVGQGGAGKTTLLVILDRDQLKRSESWLVPAANLEKFEIDDLAVAIRFAATLAGPTENIRVAVDALDEVEPDSRRQRWGEVLARLAQHDSVEVIATIRNADFERDSRLRVQLEHWAKLSLNEWTADLVRDLLIPTGYEPQVRPQLLSLLRTPILLDLFWWTFVDGRRSAANIHRLPITRHQLLSTFWSDRLVLSPRHAGLSNKPACFDPIFAAAARSLGGFKGDELDSEAIEALASEAVLVKVGLLRPQWHFRHPLLRDFALAQWCLASDSTDEVAIRWKSVAGGIQRQGALRAILEALIDENASKDYSNIRLEELTEIFVLGSDELQSAFIRAIAALPALPTFDPAIWSPTIQHRLPTDFGSELVGANRREANLSWAVRFAVWPDAAGWLDEAFAAEINSYLRLFLAGKHQTTEDAHARTDGALLARSLRRWSESKRFRGAFERDNRYQKHFAMESVAALLPERETLAWFVREVPHVTWLTQVAILENLRFVANTEPNTAADVYRRVVGLHAAGGRWALHEELWGRDISHNAFDLSLTGPDVKVSLLSSFPKAFLPVAIEMSEAMYWRDKKLREQNELTSAYLEAIQGPLSALPKEASPDELPDPLEDLIDDISDWHFETRSSPCEQAIRETAERAAEESAEDFAVELSPILRRSRLASAQGAVIEIATKHVDILSVRRVLAGCLMDGRLFHAPGLLPAIESGIGAAWHHLDSEERARLMANIEATAASRSHYRVPLARRMLLAALPLDGLDAEQRNEANAYREQELQRAERKMRTEELSEEFSGWQQDDHSKRVAAEWPEPINREKLEEFHTCYSALQGPPMADAIKNAVRAQDLMLELFPSLKVDPHAWDSENATWMWDALRNVLQTLRKPIGARTGDSETLLRGGADLALQRFEAGPTTMARQADEDEGLSGDSSWLGALAVANEALVHPELIHSVPLASRFGKAVTAAWKVGSTAEQINILDNVTFVRHWIGSGPLGTLVRGPIWTDPNDARALAAALKLLPHLQEGERENGFRMALYRTGLANAEKLSEGIGRLLGEYSMLIDEHGQRTGLVSLVNECVSNPDNFPLLTEPETQRAFLSQYAFGMKTQAKHYAAHMELAADFGRWNLSTWRHLHRLPPANNYDTTSVSLFAHYWLRETEEPSHPHAIRLRWWQELKALRQAIVEEGSARDLSRFYSLFRNGELLDLCGVIELFGSVESVLARMEPLLQTKLIALEQTSPDEPSPRHWREALDHAAHAIDWFCKTGELITPNEAESAHRLLSRLSVQPFSNATAKDALHRLVS